MSGGLSLLGCMPGTSWQPDAVAWLLVILALAIGASMVRLAWGRPFPGHPWLVGVQGCAVAWLMLAGLDAAARPGCQRLLMPLQRSAMMGMAALWMAFIVQYASSRLDKLPGWCKALTIGPCMVFSLMALTDGIHGLYFGRWVVNAYGLGQYEHGAGSFMARAWAYGILGGAGLIIVMRWRVADPIDRPTWLGFLAAFLVPWLVMLGHQVWGWHVAGHDPTPLGLVSLLAVFVVLSRGRAFDLSPHASRILFTQLGDALLVVDAQGRVVECNPAAQALSDVPCQPGSQLQTWTPWGPLLTPLCSGAPAARLLSAPGQSRRIEASAHPIKQRCALLGHLLHLHDVTELTQARESLADALRVREDALEALQARQAQLVDASVRDPLTGLLNRRALRERFDEEAAHAQHTGQALCLAMIDIDHFKTVNDSQGHAAGDEVLRCLAQHLRDGVRSGDAVFRVGGEEFVILLPGADLAHAERRLDQLRESFAAANALPGSRSPITFSAGLTYWVPGTQGLDEALKLADAALYRAKDEGRNCIRLAAAHDDSTEPPRISRSVRSRGAPTA